MLILYINAFSSQYQYIKFIHFNYSTCTPPLSNVNRMLSTSAVVNSAADVNRRRHLWLYLLYLLLVWICCYCYFPGFFSNALYARFCSVICMCACVCVVSVLAVSLQPYLLFVCLPWLLPFASRFFLFFFWSRPHFLFNQKPANGQNFKRRKSSTGGRERDG